MRRMIALLRLAAVAPPGATDALAATLLGDEAEYAAVARAVRADPAAFGV
jgi:hypothetical protein